MKNLTTLVATLGGKPRVITILLDLLLAHGYTFEQVLIVYLPADTRYKQSYRVLAGEFAGDQYQGHPCHLRGIPVYFGERSLADAYEPGEVEAVRKTFHDLLAELKNQGHTVHLGLSGGRRIMSLIALSAAMQYLTPGDHLWHIYTPSEQIQNAKDTEIPHLSPTSGAKLIEVPFIPWAAYFPGLAPLLEHTPRELGSGAWLDEADRRRCQQVWNRLTMRRREVLALLAQGFVRKEIATRLSIAVSTVDSHREEINNQCEIVWSQEGLVFHERFLQEKFTAFIKTMDQV